MRTEDPHSCARPADVAVEHLDLDLTVDFGTRTLSGRASLRLANPRGARELHLDTRDLDIHGVTLPDGTRAAFRLGEPAPDLGRPLVIEIAADTGTVHVDYSTRPEAAALQWLAPQQTAGGRQPFLFTQSQAILARTWIPLQDTPAVRFTYDARIAVPAGLMAVMSAENPSAPSADGRYSFRMPQPVPSYLMALAVGELDFRPLGPRSGVLAERATIERAAAEFADTEAMIATAERLYGPYRWGRYDLLVLPPSFPFGGMENPRLTFATPTVLAGDRSLVSLIAHELAHSWSGNLVTNATWNDFWLNEGFTVYFERRIMEELHGREFSETLAALGLQDLRKAMAELGPTSPDTRLRLELAGRNPDDAVSEVPYEKGYALLRLIEETVGRERWDRFLRTYFDAFAFQSMDTVRFLAYLRGQLLDAVPGASERIRIDEWVYAAGLPDNCSQPRSAALERVEAEIAAWQGGKPARELATAGWTTQQKLHFLHTLPAALSTGQLAELDAALALTDSSNAEVLSAWLERAIAAEYRPAYPALERFLSGMGRRKFLRPLYTGLAKTEAGLTLARRIYARARPTYHSVATSTIDPILRVAP